MPLHPMDNADATWPSSIAHEIRSELQALQTRIVQALQDAAPEDPPFGEDRWERPSSPGNSGGGCSRVLEGGAIIEKGGVLFTAIQGRPLPAVVREQQPDLDSEAEAGYFACGLSLIIHPHNPYAPTVHMNLRYFETPTRHWFGGGMDLTPYYPFREDCIRFHRRLKACCDGFDPAYYPQQKKACDDYFYLPHRQEARGIGGLFFNYLDLPPRRGLAYLLALGQCFIDVYPPLLKRRSVHPFGARQRAFQAYRRGRYVEFNLLYDQGTLFGLQSRGRTESILVSLPPKVEWHYRWQAQPDSPEAALVRAFLPPQDWAALALDP